MTAFQSRVDAIRTRIDIVDVVGRVVKLGRGAKPRGKCPFHGSKSDSFAVDQDAGRARCWGCGWHGDAIQFVRDYFGLEFGEALARLESEHGLDGLSAAPVRRLKAVRPAREAETVDSVTFGRLLWKRARADHNGVRTYLMARGVPRAVLGDERFVDVRLLRDAPIVAWRIGAAPESVPCAPAMVALVRAVADWKPIGVHATFLAPDLSAKMVRQRRDGSNYPARKMLGSVAGGAVLLGGYDADEPLFVGEGLETVLSGMAVAKARPGAIGLAALSLDVMQGRARLVRGALPLWQPEADPEASGLAIAHRGPVTALIDADMAPLPGPRDPRSGQPRGVPVIETRRGPVVRRTVTSAERSALCAALVVQAWRAKGCRVTAIRPHMGADFNEMVRGEAA